MVYDNFFTQNYSYEKNQKEIYTIYIIYIDKILKETKGSQFRGGCLISVLI